MTTEFKGYIYKHISPSGKVYIGQTINLPERRWGNGNNYQSNNIFGKAIQKYGWNNFTHHIIQEITAPTQEELLQILNNLEKSAILKYRANNPKYGYNMKEGGRNSKLSQEIRNKISKAHQGKEPWNKGLTGFKMLPETKIKLSKANKGKKKPPFSEEHRRKIGLASRGRMLNNQFRLGIPPVNKGHSKYPDALIFKDLQDGMSYSKIQKKYNIKSTATITRIKHKFTDGKSTWQLYNKTKEVKNA